MIFRPLFRVLDDRDAKIAGATKDAQGLVTKADALMNEYRDKIREAREDAATARREQIESARSEQTSITGDAKAEAEDEIGRARQEINESLAEARVTIKAASREVASVAAESILGRSL
jgi:F-type H+-transporting ATPase subunit b